MREEPIHVFGHMSPVPADLLSVIRNILESWSLSADIDCDGSLFQLAFEGVFFPHEDIMAALAPLLPSTTVGKLDVIDRENWTLTRYMIRCGTVQRYDTSLNQVLEYSGF